MPRGEPTSEEVFAEFRARYIYSGNASAVARELGLDERTGRRLAERLEDDESFAEDVRKLHARVTWKHTAMRLRVAEKALERFEGELEAPEPIENGPPITVIDKRADYGKLVLEAEKNAHNLAKFESERDGQIRPGGQVVIRVSGPAVVDGEGD